MATRKITKKIVESSIVPGLIPKDPDTKYLGLEPMFLEQPANRTAELAKSLNWYSRFYTRKDAKEFLIQYLNTVNPVQAKVVSKVDDAQINPSLCWLSRMVLRGLTLTNLESDRMQNEILRLVETVKNPKNKESQLTVTKNVQEKRESVRPNVQEIMKEKAKEAAGELEGMFDEFYLTGSTTQKTLDIVAKFNILPQHIHLLTDVWKRKYDEFAILSSGDKEIVQAYRPMGKIQIRNLLKFIEQVISDLNSYISIKKVAKTPRKKKAVPVEKLVSKLKYCKTFVDPATKLNLISVHPTKLHGASECYLFDTSKRKLIYMCADEYSKTFSVKGTTILGFDSAKSQSKTVRKPSEQISQFMKLGKPAGRKFFDEIKAVGTTPNGRTNENMIILKAW